MHSGSKAKDVVRPARASARRRVRFMRYQGIAGDKAGNGTELGAVGPAIVHTPVARELAPAGLRSSPRRSPRCFRLISATGLGLLRSPAGASSLATKAQRGIRPFRGESTPPPTCAWAPTQQFTGMLAAHAAVGAQAVVGH